MNKRQTEREREKQLKKLIESSSPADCEAIERGRSEGRQLRAELEGSR